MRVNEVECDYCLTQLKMMLLASLLSNRLLINNLTLSVIFVTIISVKKC